LRAVLGAVSPCASASLRFAKIDTLRHGFTTSPNTGVVTASLYAADSVPV